MDNKYHMYEMDGKKAHDLYLQLLDFIDEKKWSNYDAITIMELTIMNFYLVDKNLSFEDFFDEIKRCFRGMEDKWNHGRKFLKNENKS